MKTVHLLAVVLLAAVPTFGCAREHGPVATQQPAASRARVAGPMGVAERQPPSHPAVCEDLAPTTEDVPPPAAQVGVKPDGARAPAEAVPPQAQMIQLPTGAVLTSRITVNEIGAFPEELQNLTGPPQTVEGTIGVRGVDRRYASNLSYRDTIGFFDWSLLTYGFQDLRRTTTSTATLWSVRCANGESARVAVRQGNPPTVEVIEANERESR